MATEINHHSCDIIKTSYIAPLHKTCVKNFTPEIHFKLLNEPVEKTIKYCFKKDILFNDWIQTLNNMILDDFELDSNIIWEIVPTKNNNQHPLIAPELNAVIETLFPSNDDVAYKSIEYIINKIGEGFYIRRKENNLQLTTYTCHTCYNDTPVGEFYYTCDHHMCRTCFSDWQYRHDNASNCPMCRMPYQGYCRSASNIMRSPLENQTNTSTARSSSLSTTPISHNYIQNITSLIMLPLVRAHQNNNSIQTRAWSNRMNRRPRVLRDIAIYCQGFLSSS